MRSRLVIAIVVTLAVSCLALGLFVANILSQPVVSCAPAPKNPFSTLLVTPVSAQDYFEQGAVDYERGDCDEAIADYTRAIELNSNLAEAFNNRAYVYRVKRDYALALPDLDRAIQLRPNYVNALMNRGDIYNYYYSINYDRALADYDRVLQIQPSAASHTSVCGHRLLALQHGWTLNAVVELLSSRAAAGCPSAAQ